jgi:2-polyprenyl-3-methyl-5-hydroxy-6-metoxy-1,4-benzoquinol methylase
MQVNWDNYTNQLTGSTATNVDLIKVWAQGIVLDVGCGLGKHLTLLDNAMFKVGIDAGLSGLHKAKSLLNQLQLVCGNTYQLPLRSEIFDAVIMIDVIEHLEYPRLALQEISRILKPMGILFIQTPNYPAKRVYDYWHWCRGSRHKLSDDPTHVSKFNSYRWISMISEEKFRIQFVTARNVFFDEYLRILRCLRKNFIGKAFGQKIIIIAKNAHNYREAV